MFTKFEATVESKIVVVLPAPPLPARLLLPLSAFSPEALAPAPPPPHHPEVLPEQVHPVPILPPT